MEQKADMALGHVPDRSWPKPLPNNCWKPSAISSRVHACPQSKN